MRLFVVCLAVILAAAEARAQTPPAPSAQPAVPLPATMCNLQVPAPAKLPPAGTGPYTYIIIPCFEKQGGIPVVDAQTYLFYMEMVNRRSRPSENIWVPYNDETEQAIVADFRRLWATNFLDDLSIEVRDVRFENGVIGKVILYNMEERQRVKIVDYLGSDKVDQQKIEEELRDKGIQIRLDSFIDPGLIRRVAGIVRELYATKGYMFAEVKPEVKEVEGAAKTVHVTFNISEGPKVKIRELEFVGNQKISDRALSKRMKENKGPGMFSFILPKGTYKEDKFGEDADKIVEYYRDNGYIAAQVGQPDLKVLEDEEDGKTRWVQLRVPVTEGDRYKIGDFNFEGNTVVKDEALKGLFQFQQGEYYSEKKIKKSLDKAREIYGAGGYYEFVAFPDLKPRNVANGNGAAGPAAPAAAKADAPAVVDVTMKVTEGKQYFVNRITFTGNTTTRDNVIRREIRLLEAGVFNTEALKYSIKRLNQLGYFKALEGDAIQVEKTPGADNKVDLSLKLEEQNRNQLTFGAGVSQFDGFFGQLAFQTSNFLGRGETFTISAQAGNRAKNYQLAFTEPFLFDKPMTAGVDLFIREIRWPGQFTQASAGGNLVYGFQTGDFSRMYLNYSLEQVKVKDLNPLYLDPLVIGRNPFLQDSLLIGQGGRRTISKISPSWVFNTVDQPIFPTSGTRYTFSLDYAGIGGNTNFVNPRVEGIWYVPVNRRTSFGFRAQGEYIRPYGSTRELPIYERLYLGGEYSMRGFDIRTVGPRDPDTAVVLGGNKSLLFNAEYLIHIAGPVRLVLFADAGQVRDTGENFAWKEPVIQRNVQGVLIADSILDPYYLFNPINFTPRVTTEVVGEAAAFKTSIGAEIRFFMPVLNVPFRLIFAMNPSRYGVLDNNLQPEKKYKFRFAVGTTF
ncbi:MAG TPA: outer membrane protein assembly factor BamA [Vicinamibacterales bacterium]|nr:outer membrane protein assembly factor BamA [Vicinamibacterales bacterium]